jgi:hypothetical protein
MKTNGERYRYTFSLTLVLDGGAWSTTLLDHFSPGKSPSTNLTGGWESLRTTLDKCLKSHPHRGSNPNHPFHSQI